jgi:hypothetical protein
MLHAQPRLMLLDIHASNIRRKAQSIKLLIIWFSSVIWHCISLWFKCYPRHFVLNNLQSTFTPRDQVTQPYTQYNIREYSCGLTGLSYIRITVISYLLSLKCVTITVSGTKRFNWYIEITLATYRSNQAKELSAPFISYDSRRMNEFLNQCGKSRPNKLPHGAHRLNSQWAKYFGGKEEEFSFPFTFHHALDLY